MKHFKRGVGDLLRVVVVPPPAITEDGVPGVSPAFVEVGHELVHAIGVCPVVEY